jgi:hypothetical protein
VTYSAVAVVVGWGETERALRSVIDAQSYWTFETYWTVYFGVGILQVRRGKNFGSWLLWYWRVSMLHHCVGK